MLGVFMTVPGTRDLGILTVVFRFGMALDTLDPVYIFGRYVSDASVGSCPPFSYLSHGDLAVPPPKISGVKAAHTPLKHQRKKIQNFEQEIKSTPNAINTLTDKCR